MYEDFLSKWLMTNKTEAKAYSYVELVSLLDKCGIPREKRMSVINALIAEQIIVQTPNNYYYLSSKGLKKRLLLPLVFDKQKVVATDSGKTNRVNPEEWNFFRKLCSYYSECVQYNERSDNYIRFVGNKCCLKTVNSGCSVYFIPSVMPYGWLEIPSSGLTKELNFKYTEDQEYAVASIKSRGDEIDNYLGYPLIGHYGMDGEVFYTTIVQIPIEEIPVEKTAPKKSISFKLDFEHAFINPMWIETCVPVENRRLVDKLEEKCSEIRDGHAVLRLDELIRLAFSLSYQSEKYSIDYLSPNQVLPVMRGTTKHQLFNTAIIFQAKSLHYSKVMKRELDYIANEATNEELDATALAYLFRKHPFEDEKKTSIAVPFITSNQEQTEAVEKAQENRVVVVQGPPGTGKTQMAVNLIANCVFDGETVLFTSTNHQAINAIRDRAGTLFDDISLVQFCADEDGDFMQSWFDIDLRVENSMAQLKKDTVSNEDIYSSDAILRLKDIKEKYSVWNDIYSEYTKYEKEYEDNLKKCLATLKITEPLCSFELPQELFSKQKILLKTKFSFFDWILFRVRKLKASRAVALSWMKSNFPILYDENFSSFSQTTDNLERDINQAKEYMRKALAVQKKLSVLEKKIKSLPEWNEGFEEFGAKMLQLSKNCKDAFSFRYYNRLGDGISEDKIEELEIFQSNNKIKRGFDWSKNHSEKLRLLRPDPEYDKYRASLADIYRIHPAWAVTLQSVSRAFPCIPGVIDQVIVDESSQCLPASIIPVLFRAKRIVVVGDEKQFKPITQLKERTHSLILQRHKMVDDERPLFFTKSSAYDIAQYKRDRGKYKVMLKEHFRCNDDIANFINDNVYEGRMRIRSTEHGFKLPDKCGYKHAVEWVDVKNSKRQEIDEVINRVRMLAKSNYDGSIGIISPLRTIANEINQSLYEEKLSEYVDKCSTAYSYQGGEQDLIIFVLGLNDETLHGQRWYIEGGGEASENILNVAISRAKALLLVIGDKEEAKNSKSSIIRKLASFNPAKKKKEPVCESPYEQKLVDELTREGIAHKIQYPLVGRRLDVAIECDKCKIDVEVDGVHYHTNADGYRKFGDMYRDVQVKAAGWLVLRFWSFDLRDNMSACIERIKETMRNGCVSDEIEWRSTL